MRDVVKADASPPVQKIETMRHAIAPTKSLLRYTGKAVENALGREAPPTSTRRPSDTIRRFQYPFVRLDTRRDNCSSTLCQNFYEAACQVTRLVREIDIAFRHTPS